MLKKVMAMLASKYLAIKVRIRAVETHLMIQSLLLRDKKMIRHLFRHRRHFNISNKVKDDSVDEEDDYQPQSPDALINTSNSFASSPYSTVQVTDEAEGTTDDDDDDDDDDDGGGGGGGGGDGCGDYADSRHLRFEDGEEDQSVSVMKMAKHTTEERGESFILEDDIDKVADLFIQRFHQQIRLQKLLSEDE